MSQPATIALSDLDVGQLADVKRQLEEELGHLTESYTQLKQAQAKFAACIDNVKQLNKGLGFSTQRIRSAQSIDKPILVPLTNSLYVPGKLSDTDHVIVDVGTGYFVKKAGVHLIAV